MMQQFLSEIKLEEGFLAQPRDKGSPVVQVLRVTKFTHPEYGDIEITPETLVKMKENFDNRVRRQDLPLDYFHENEKAAAGWFKELFLSVDGQELWAKVDWTKRALQMLQEKELRYFSPEFSFQWTDPETNVSYENVLFGGGLTNRPQVKDMAPIMMGEKNFMQLKEAQEKLVQLEEKVAAMEGDYKKLEEDMISKDSRASELDAKIIELESMLEELKAQKEAISGEKDTMEMGMKKALEENAMMKKDAEAKDKEMQFSALLTEGKACVAQKEAFMAGDLKKFAELSAPVNPSARGGGNDPSPTSKEEASKKVIELAEIISKEKKIDLGEAVSQVLQNNKDLAKAYNA
jgi:hypothetical protein